MDQNWINTIVDDLCIDERCGEEDSQRESILNRPMKVSNDDIGYEMMQMHILMTSKDL